MNPWSSNLTQSTCQSFEIVVLLVSGQVNYYYMPSFELSSTDLQIGNQCVNLSLIRVLIKPLQMGL